MLTNQTTPRRGKWLFWGLCALLSILVSVAVTTATVYADLPPRPGLPPNEDDKDDDEPRRPLVATIILSTSPTQSGLWSVVQWQKGNGEWQDVVGWRGTVVNGRTIWWVEEKDFGKTPYRWLVFQGEGGALLATSQSFALPAQPKQQLMIEATLP